MISVIQLIKVSFGHLENHLSNAIVEREVALFIDEADKTALTKCNEFLEDVKITEPLTLGHDDKVYPYFVIKYHQAR